tara:strand:- start:2742 stop:3164 length:423 start_codon:yes stop_codon:yes gene_type:complete
MHNFYKTAYDLGAQKALQDHGITKVSDLSDYVGTSNYIPYGAPDEEGPGQPGSYRGVPIREAGFLDRFPLFGKRPYVLPENVDSLREALSKIKGIDVATDDWTREHGDPNEPAVEFGHLGSGDDALEAALSKVLLAARGQ